MLRWLFTQPDQTVQALHAALDRNGDPGLEMEMVRDVEHLQKLMVAAGMIVSIVDVLAQLQ